MDLLYEMNLLSPSRVAMGFLQRIPRPQATRMIEGFRESGLEKLAPKVTTTKRSPWKSDGILFSTNRCSMDEITPLLQRLEEGEKRLENFASAEIWPTEDGNPPSVAVMVFAKPRTLASLRQTMEAYPYVMLEPIVLQFWWE